MQRAKRMCKTCPFRGVSESERYELALVEPEAWTCHSEHPHGWGDTQCRGHFEARRKYPVAEHEAAAFSAWQEEFNKAFVAGVNADKLPLAPMRADLQKLKQ